jgi:hypothetical protein
MAKEVNRIFENLDVVIKDTIMESWLKCCDGFLQSIVHRTNGMLFSKLLKSRRTDTINRGQAISAMMGHSRNNTTQIYLKNLPASVLDGYNEQLIRAI